MFGTLPFQRPDGFRGLYLDGPPHGFPPLDDVLGVVAPQVVDGALAVGSQEGAQLANVLL